MIHFLFPANFSAPAIPKHPNTTHTNESYTNSLITRSLPAQPDTKPAIIIRHIIKNGINPIIDFKNHFQFKDKLIKENKELHTALEKSYLEKYLISQDSKFFKDAKFLEEKLDQNNLNKPFYIAQLKNLDPNIFNCCDKHRMHIQ